MIAAPPVTLTAPEHAALTDSITHDLAASPEWEATPELRWRQAFGLHIQTRPILQQLWRCGMQSEWRDVPSVTEGA